MLKPNEAFYVYDPETGRIRYTVNSPAPEGLVDALAANSEVFVLADMHKNAGACYVSLQAAAVFSEIILPLYVEREGLQAALMQLIARADTLRGKVLPYAGYEKEKVPEAVLVAAEELESLADPLKDLEDAIESLNAAIDTHTYENGCPVIARPALDIPTEYEIQHGGEEVTFALPPNTVWAFNVEGIDAGTHTDEFSMSAVDVGDYHVQAVCWPYEDFQAIVHAV